MKTIKYLFCLVLVSAFIVACGGEEKKEDEKSVKIKKQSDSDSKDDENVVNLLITGDDFMKFNKDSLVVKAGQKVRLTLRHIGKMEKNIMGHNVVILKKDVDAAEFAARAATERENDYIPKDSDQVLAHTEMIGGGQTTTIEFIAPEVGVYDFLCSFPAHFQNMQGKFIVEE